MNITELARMLKVTPQELRDLLPDLGFNIGQKAIKVDNNTAKKIIKNWSVFRRKLEMKRALQEKKRQEEEKILAVKRKVEVPATVSVRDLADIANLPVNKILAELMKNGVFASINEKIDFETALIIGADLGLEVMPAAVNDDLEIVPEEKKLSQVISEEDPEKLSVRPPVIVVMGHVDHGKTKLLDSIRLTNVVAGEAGGITQHIGAYQVFRNNRSISFIDTPGHEAFTAMRSRGAKVADIAILVVAADDGVMPQTIEAFRIIEAAKIPYLVAMNKVDKPEADIDKTKQELATKLNITPEDWGGKTICVPVSAKDGIGIEELLDMVLLTADTELTDSLRANPQAPAMGTVVESNIDKNAGPLATLLVQNGTLRVGDELTFNGIFYGKVKALKNYKGEQVESAGPSSPVKVYGFKISPEVGDILSVGVGKKIKIRKIKGDAHSENISSIKDSEANKENIPAVNIVIKSDFLGSAEAIEESLLKINTEKVRVDIIANGLGNVTEGDIKRAEDSGAFIIGFNVKTPPQVENLAREKNISIKNFSIIYDLIKDIKAEMQSKVKAEITRVEEGEVKVLAIFRTDNDGQIIGGKVSKKTINLESKAEIWRGEDILATGTLTKLQLAKQDVKEVEPGQECGLQFKGKPFIEVGDVLKVYHEDSKIDIL